MPVKQNTKSFFSFLLRIGLSLGLLVFVFSKIDMQKTGEILKTADLFYIALTAVVFILVNVITLYRWFILIRALNLTITLGSVIEHGLYGLFGNLFLPTAIGGDILKAVGLCKTSAQKPRVVASILLDRVSGFASIAIVAVTAFLFGRQYINDDTLVIPIALVGGLTVAVAAVLLNERVFSFGCKIFNGLPRFKKSLMTMHYDIALLKEGHKYKEWIKAVLLSCLSQTIFASTFYLTAKALHQDIPFIYFLIFVPMICVATAFPSIGGLGVREVGAVYLFAKVGVDSGIAVSMSLISFLFMVMVGAAGGVLYVYKIYTGRVQSFTPDDGVEPSEA
jgi:uncharacterized protein (TIRG00374 family)